MLILATLRRGTLHGYAIARRIETVSEELLRVEEGSLYPALQRMLIEGWVSAEWTDSPRGSRRVREYKLTPAGRKQLDREVKRVGRAIEGTAKVMRMAEA